MINGPGYQAMTNEEWSYHRSRAVPIRSFGLCSKMRNGLIKTEGYEPCTMEKAKARATHHPKDVYDQICQELDKLV